MGIFTIDDKEITASRTAGSDTINKLPGVFAMQLKSLFAAAISRFLNYRLENHELIVLYEFQPSFIGDFHLLCLITRGYSIFLPYHQHPLASTVTEAS